MRIVSTLIGTLVFLCVASGCRPRESQAIAPAPVVRPAVASSAQSGTSPVVAPPARTRPAAGVEKTAAERVVALRPADFLGGRLRLLVPAEFDAMGPELVRIKYSSTRRPDEVLTNDDGTVNIGVSHTATRVTPAQLASLFQSMTARLKRTQPQARWFQSEMGSINGRKFFLLDFRTPAADTNVRNIMLGTSFQGRLLLINVNMTEALEDTWMPAGNKMIASIQIK